MTDVERGLIADSVKQACTGAAVVRMPSRIDLYGVGVYQPIHVPRQEALGILRSAGIQVLDN